MALNFLNDGYFAGKVGIGTETLFTGAELDVYGDIVLMQKNWALRGNNANADFCIEELIGTGFSDANVKLTIKSGGNVGIGTTSPTEKLDISGTAIVRSTLFTVGNVHGFTSSYGASFFINNSGGTSYFNATGGNVGIGTTSPVYKLDVAGTGNFTGLVSGITPVNAANFVTKAYVDGSGGGTGPFLPLAGGIMTGTTGVTMPDSFPLFLGTSGINDSQIFWDGGNIEIQARKASADIVFRAANSSGVLGEFLAIDGGVQKTRAYKDIHFQDNIKATFGDTTNPDLQIYHDGSNSFIQDTGTGDLYVDAAANFFVRNQANGEVWIKGTDSGVSLRYQDSQKLITTNTGVAVTGSAFINGNTDNSVEFLTVDDGDPTVGSQRPHIKFTGAGTQLGKIRVLDNGVGMQFLNSADSIKLTIADSGNATFAGKVQAANWFQGVSATNTLYSATSTGLLLQTPGATQNDNDSKIKFRNSNTTVTHTFDCNSGSATFTGQGFSSATSSGDASSTLTTKGYVDGLITGATIYRGTWNPDKTQNSGYGVPNLSTVTQTSGYYYICSAIGIAEPNGSGCEPNSWDVGDWVIWNDDVVDCAGTGTGAWQKIDNSSVLSGAGTGQTVALWEGASSVTDSETLGNSPITVSGNNVLVSAGLQLIRTSDPFIQFYEGSTNVGDIFTDTSLNNLVLRGGSSHGVRIMSNSAADNSETGITLDTSYNVGIGTTLPDANLEVVASTVIPTASDGVNSILMGLSGSNRTALQFDTADTTHTNRKWGLTNIAGDFYVGRTGLNVMTMKNNGNVGIGTDSPERKLHVQSGSAGSVTSSSEADLVVESNDHTAINLLTPDNKQSAIYFGTVSDNIGGGVYWNYSSKQLTIATLTTSGGDIGFRAGNNSEKMRILANGNVGIGTTIFPYSSKIAITSSASAKNTLSIQTTDVATGTAGTVLYLGLGASTGNSTYGSIRALGTGGTAVTNLVLQSDGGNVGIGTTTPQSKLQVAGGIQMADDTDTAVVGKVGTMRYRTGTEYVEVTGINLDVLPASGGTPDAYLLGAYGNNTATYANQISTLTFVDSSAGGYHYFNTSTNMSSAVVVNNYYIARITFKVNTGTIQWHLYTGAAYINSEISSGTGYQTMEINFQALSATNVFIKTRNMSTGQIVDISLCEFYEATTEDASYADMCMQTGASTYEWVNIVRNTY